MVQVCEAIDNETVLQQQFPPAVTMKPSKPLTIRVTDVRRKLKIYKERLKMKTKSSRLLIMAISDKFNEKEMEVEKIRKEADIKLYQVWQNLIILQSSLSKEQTRLSQLLQDKENIIQSQTQEISQLRLASEGNKSTTCSNCSKTGNIRGDGSSFRRSKRERNSITRNIEHNSSTEESSPGSTPKQGPNRVVSRQSSADIASSDGVKLKDVIVSGLSRQNNMFTKGSERPKIKTNTTTSEEELKSPKSILKPSISTKNMKPPVPSRNKVNEKLKSGSGTVIGGTAFSSDESSSYGRHMTTRLHGGVFNRDSGNSSLDSSDPSNNIEWRLSVRPTLPLYKNNSSTDNKVNLNISENIQTTKVVNKKDVKPQLPPRRSKSYERSSSNQEFVKINKNVRFSQQDIQRNFEEYDLDFIDIPDKTFSSQGTQNIQMHTIPWLQHKQCPLNKFIYSNIDRYSNQHHHICHHHDHHKHNLDHHYDKQYIHGGWSSIISGVKNMF